MRRGVIAGLILVAAAAAQGRAAAQRGYPPGVFVGTPGGPVELIAWAEAIRNGQLRMSSGTLKDVPSVSSVTRVLANLPNWKPAGVLIASEEIFRDEYAERRQLPFATRPLDVSAIEIRIADLERTDRLRRLLHNVRASEDTPGYVFVVMASGGLGRFYPFRIGMTVE